MQSTDSGAWWRRVLELRESCSLNSLASGMERASLMAAVEVWQRSKDIAAEVYVFHQAGQAFADLGAVVDICLRGYFRGFEEDVF